MLCLPSLAGLAGQHGAARALETPIILPLEQKESVFGRSVEGRKFSTSVLPRADFGAATLNLKVVHELARPCLQPSVSSDSNAVVTDMLRAQT